MENFPQVVPQFLAANAVVQVPDEAALARTLRELFSDPARREAMGESARAVVGRNRGSISRTVDLILQDLPIR
jgi:3-deoxy-D-manno-octulosonic-acid transferase